MRKWYVKILKNVYITRHRDNVVVWFIKVVRFFFFSGDTNMRHWEGGRIREPSVTSQMEEVPKRRESYGILTMVCHA